GTPPFPGWCPATRQTLATALGSHAIPNRHGLPPHRYLEIATWGQLDDATRRYVTSAGWDQFLIRPTGAGLGLTTLTQAANQFWNQGDRSAALREQCRFGPVSIEVYYLSGIEMA
ncbi:MAG TPA: hypothetical protein VFQ39_19645, partial [Longimicrobium sp.]|nr:hypothetical protein [Longimicrobium sp.]